MLSVDYRLAPEFKYPVAAEDSYAALGWAVANAARLGIDRRRVAVGGDSAGGNLATVVALMARERGGPTLVHQMLIYPVTDHDLDTPSYRENATGYVLTREGMRWFWGHYLARESQGQEPYASPLRAPSLAGLPPALVITAECDPLRDEGEAYAARLRDAGVPVDAHPLRGDVPRVRPHDAHPRQGANRGRRDRRLAAEGVRGGVKALADRRPAAQGTATPRTTP